MQNKECPNSNFWQKMTREGRIIVEIFVAGAGLIFWLTATVLNPITDVKRDIAQIKENTAEIKLSLERHLSKSEITDEQIRSRVADQDKAIAIILERITK